MKFLVFASSLGPQVIFGHTLALNTSLCVVPAKVVTIWG